MTLGMGQQITVFVILAKTVGTGLVVPFPVVLLAVDPPVEVAEPNAPVGGNGLLNGIYIIICAYRL